MKKTNSYFNLSSIAFYALWAVGLCFVIANTSLKPRLASRAPASVTGALPTAWFLAPTKSVVATHFFAASDACSETVALKLLERGPSQVVDERIILIGESVPSWAIELAKRKFFVKRVAPGELPPSIGAASAPQLWLESSRGRSLYRGGYSERRPDQVAPRDIELFNDALSGKMTNPYPVFDCGSEIAVKTSPTGEKENSLARMPSQTVEEE